MFFRGISPLRRTSPRKVLVLVAELVFRGVSLITCRLQVGSLTRRPRIFLNDMVVIGCAISIITWRDRLFPPGAHRLCGLDRRPGYGHRAHLDRFESFAMRTITARALVKASARTTPERAATIEPSRQSRVATWCPWVPRGLAGGSPSLTHGYTLPPPSGADHAEAFRASCHRLSVVPSGANLRRQTIEPRSSLEDPRRGLMGMATDILTSILRT